MADRQFPAYPPPPPGYYPPGYPSGYPPRGYPPGPGGYPPSYYPQYWAGGYPRQPWAPMPIPSYPAPPPTAPDDQEITITELQIGVEEVVELPWRAYRWVPASTYSMPPGALHVGTDQDGTEIFAGRATHEGDIIPAKIIPSKSACYVSYGGEEHLKNHFEVLVPATFAWQFSTGGQVPPGAVEVGTTADGEKLYMGRVTAEGCQTPGKIQPSHGVCYYPFDGEERSSDEYEVLVFQ